MLFIWIMIVYPVIFSSWCRMANSAFIFGRRAFSSFGSPKFDWIDFIVHVHNSQRCILWCWITHTIFMLTDCNLSRKKYFMGFLAFFLCALASKVWKSGDSRIDKFAVHLFKHQTASGAFVFNFLNVFLNTLFLVFMYFYFIYLLFSKIIKKSTIFG